MASANKILIVDDTPANLVAAESALEPLGRPIVTAASGDEALAHLLDHEFALALVDVNMPGMDGYELAQLIRSRQRTEHLPIIFMTAHACNETDVLRAYKLGAVDFLFKPIVPEILRTKAGVFVTLQERNEQLAAERMERDFETRRRDYETAALRRERDRDLAAKEELERFVAILAHELRNPLASLRSCIELLQDAPARPPESNVVGALDRQTNMLVRLVDDLLDVSRIKAGKIELKPELVELADVVDAAIAMCRPSIDTRRHELALEVCAEPVPIVADPVRLSQVVANVLGNAARYTAPGGRIAVTLGASGDEAFVRIRDNGIGIPTELQESIFTMFVQERVRSDGSGGLGLGLALARRLIEMHAGTIAVHSDGRDRGSTFELRMPCAGSPRALAARTRVEPPAPRAASVRSLRAIVIDDNDDARELMSTLLRNRGHHVLTAGDGVRAVELIREHRPDVALVDLGLPRLDGFGVVETLRRECPDLPTRMVALTGYGADADRERTRDAGFHEHLVKPVTAAAVLACLGPLAGR
jgi:two-component system, sensor histidine kinase